MRNPAAFSLALLLAVGALCQENAGYVPKAGYVPDSKTAVKIAEAVLVPVYGERQIESERPFAAALKGEVWTVTGTLRCADGKGGATTQCEGGVAIVAISKGDARVLSMMHGK
ncbi:MAG: YbbC/YhhH family protein [Candidatus Sulfotelmatobacter sp.]